MQFRQWLEAQEQQYYYHVTYVKNLSSIGWRGLLPNARPNWRHGGYDANSRSGLFLTNAKYVPHWLYKLRDLAEHNSDDILKDKLVPVILRVTVLRPDRLKDDEMGDATDSWAYPHGIRSNRVEMWTGHVWTPTLSPKQLKPKDFLSRDKYGVSFLENYPFPPEIA